MAKDPQSYFKVISTLLRIDPSLASRVKNQISDKKGHNEKADRIREVALIWDLERRVS